MRFYDRLRDETATERAALYTVPQLVDGLRGAVSREMHVAHLEQAYHHVSHTVSLLTLMVGYLPKDKEWLRPAILEYISEETGHEDWILNDITKIAGKEKAESVRNGHPGLAVELINAFNYDFITRRNPLGYLGMIFVLEHASIDLAAQGAEALHSSLGLDKECFSYFMSHGSLDQEHVEFIKGLLNQISDSRDQNDIIHAAKVIYRLYAEMFRAIPYPVAV